VAASIEAVGEVPAARDEVFAFLAALPNHWALANRWIEVVSLDEPRLGVGGAAPEGGVVRIRGPLGLRRTARTRVLRADPPRRLSGRAELPGGTAATVTWSLEEANPGTRVRLAAEVEESSALDSLLLAAGERAWMRRHFATVLETLATQFAADQPARQ
jgi:Polyketide cyclase / dehydrase and lipid transport